MNDDDGDVNTFQHPVGGLIGLGPNIDNGN